MKLLDTTFLIHYWQGDADAGAYLAANEDAHRFVATTISLKELAVGRHRHGEFDPTELESTFGWVDVLPFALDHAYEAAKLEADLWASDRSRRRVEALAGDVLIAGTARALDAPVVTRDTDDFGAFDGVAVEPY